MSKEHEQHATKASEQAMRENDAHTRKTNSHDVVPGDDTAHAHSHAAHLQSANEKTKPEENQPGGSKVGELREPAAGVGERNIEHRRQ